MNCTGCGHDNRDTAKFCLGCGQRFNLACQGCGAELPPNARFCDECGAATTEAGGEAVEPERASLPEPRERAPRDYTPAHLAEKILQSKAALEGERKRVTVFFADVTHSMELAEGLDPETWHGILDGLFQILADGVHRFEGTVNQYTGDGVMALFGAPLAHEDHAQRACYAALHLRGELDRYATEVMREHGVGVSVRMGLNSGDVVVGKIGDDLRMDYTAQGHTVGLAQRMEALSAPGTCYLGANTAELATGYFELEDLGEFQVKGVSEPVAVHRLVGLGPAQTRFDVSRARGLTRFVGRDGDMRLLDDAIAQARAGNGQVIGVVAPAGTGKSRLCFEFVERCRAEGLEVLEGRAVAHGRNIPFLPILEIFRAYFGVEDSDSDRAVREKVAGRLLLIDDALRDDLPVLFEFFGVTDREQPPLKLDADMRQRKLFGLMDRLARDDQGSEPRVYLVEDLHWIDPGSELFLERMVDATAGTGNLILVNFRPEYHAGWMSRSWYRQLPLAPLGADAIRELLDDLLGGDPSTEGLASSIHERTGGNPFFTEEVIQSLIESGHLEGARGAYRLVTPIERLGVPASVHAVLAARIDRLAEREKRVLQAAGVIGKDFARPILEPVTEIPGRDLDAAIALLKDGEFVYEQSLYPVAEYAFKHPLTQEVALASLLRERRRNLHRAVANAIETERADNLDEHAALLAHHWEGAGEALPAAGWHRRAALWPGNPNVEESMRHWERVRELLADVPGDDAEELILDACAGILGLGWRVGIDLTPIYEQGRALAEGRDDVDAAARLLIAHSRGVAGRGELTHYLALCEEAIQATDRTGDMGLRGNARLLLIDACNWVGDHDRGIETGTRWLEIFPPDPSLGADIFGMGVLGLILHCHGIALAWGGRFEEGAAQLRRSVEIGTEREEYELLTWSHCMWAAAAWLQGDAETAAREARRGAGFLEPAGNAAQGRVWASRAALCTKLAEGAFEEAVTAADDWLAIYESERVEVLARPDALAFKAEALRRAGRFQEALDVAEQATRESHDMGRGACELIARLAHGVALANVRGVDARAEVAASFEEAARLIDKTGCRPFLPQLHEARAGAANAWGDAEERKRELQEAKRLFEERDCPGRAARIGEELASLGD